MALSIVDDKAKRDAVNRASQYDIRRTGVERERQAALKRQRERIGAQMGAQNLSDSGIQSAEERAMRTRVGREAAIQRGAIDVEELRAGEARAEAERERSFLGEQAELGREFTGGQAEANRTLERERMDQAGELARRGLSLQETAMELQRQGMSEADARYYAGLAHESTEAQIGREFVSTQADKQRGYESIERELDRGLRRDELNQAYDLATQGINLQDAALQLRATGMDMQNAQFYANLAQAKVLADQGFSLQDRALQLQQAGLDQQEALFFIEMADRQKARDMEYDMFGTQVTEGFKLAILGTLFADMDPGTDEYRQLMYSLLDETGVMGPQAQPGAPATLPQTGVIDESPTKGGFGKFIRKIFGRD